MLIAIFKTKIREETIMKNKKHFFKKGFTLVELVVVIAVIAILAAVSVGAYFGVTNSANESKLRTEGKAVFDAVKIAAIEGKGDYTLESTGLTLNDGVNNKQKFNYELNYLTGVNYIIVYETPTLIEGPTLFIYNADEINGSYNSSSTYTIINYYSPRFKYEQFEEIRSIMPWIVMFEFDGDRCLKIEAYNVFTKEMNVIK